MVINKVYSDKDNILIQDDKNKLWIMGDNSFRRTGVGRRSEPIYKPKFTNIKLDHDEYVTKFYVREYLMVIYTSFGKLYVSRAMYRKIKKDQVVSLEESNNEETESVSDENESVLVEDTNNEIVVHEYSDVISDEENDSDTEQSPDPIPSHENIRMGVTHKITHMAIIDGLAPLREKNVINKGFDLIDNQIDDVMFVENTIFFLKNGKIYIYNAEVTPFQVMYGTLSMEINLIKCKNDNTIYYYQLVLPFDYDKCILEKNFVYVKSGLYHHIITLGDHAAPSSDEPICSLVWYYYKCSTNDLDDMHKRIYYNYSSASLYLEDKNEIYLFCAEDKIFKKYINSDSKNLFIPCSDDEYNYVLIVIKNGKIYRDISGLSKEVTAGKLSIYMIDMVFVGEILMVIIDTDTVPSREFIVSPSVFYFNVYGLIYRVVNDGVICYDTSSGLIYYYTDFEMDESRFDMFEIERYDNDGNIMYVYAYNNMPSNVTDITFTNNLFVIQSDNRYFYHIFDSDDFIETKITEIIIDNPSDMNLVKKQMVTYDKNKCEDSIELYVSINSNKLSKLMNIIEFLRDETDFHIKFTEGTKIISYGDGPKREFMDAAMLEFANKYLLNDSAFPDFNLDQFEKINDDELIVIGYMIHAVICHNLNHLAIRLPLSLMQTILNKTPSIKELEHFITKYDPELYHTLQIYKDKPNSEFETEFGYASYRECLESLCKLFHDEKTQTRISHITKLISKGFQRYHNIKNLSNMNFPTFDYYLSGDFHINRDLLIKNLVIHNEAKLTVNYLEIIKQIIQNLSEEKIITLIRNWSATSIVKNTPYRINIISNHNKDIHFATCNFELTISDNLFKNSEVDNLLIDLLTTPVDHMFDP